MSNDMKYLLCPFCEQEIPTDACCGEVGHALVVSDCDACEGMGIVTCTDDSGRASQDCETCKGKGHVEAKP